MIIQGARPLRDITELGPTPAGSRTVLACPPDDVELWTDSAEQLGVKVHVIADPAVAADSAFTWAAAMPTPRDAAYYERMKEKFGDRYRDD